MNRRFARGLGSVVLVSSVLFSWSARLAPLAAVGMMLPACDSAQCSPRNCSDIGGGDKAYESCASCAGEYGCSIELRDDTGKAFYNCDDSDGKKCSTDPDFVSAQESYCGL